MAQQDLAGLPSIEILAGLRRDQIEALVEAAIDHLDTLDGGPDAETTDAEDDFTRRVGMAPGCPISDPGGSDLDDGEIGAHDPDARRDHLAQLRRNRCSAHRWRHGGIRHYTLWREPTVPSKRSLLSRKRGVPPGVRA